MVNSERTSHWKHVFEVISPCLYRAIIFFNGAVYMWSELARTVLWNELLNCWHVSHCSINIYLPMLDFAMLVNHFWTRAFVVTLHDVHVLCWVLHNTKWISTKTMLLFQEKRWIHQHRVMKNTLLICTGPYQVHAYGKGKDYLYIFIYDGT